jgi:excisionase family DNA binding protein
MELLTVQETAALLRVSPVTVRRYIASRRLAAVRVGRGVRILKEDAENLPLSIEAETYSSSLKSRRKGPTSETDPLWNIVGVARSEGPTDVSSNKHKYLADAYADLHEK